MKKRIDYKAIVTKQNEKLKRQKHALRQLTERLKIAESRASTFDGAIASMREVIEGLVKERKQLKGEMKILFLQRQIESVKQEKL